MATNYMELDEIPDSGEWEVIKRRKRNTGGESTYLFQESSIDSKLTLMFDELKSIKTDTGNTQKLLSLNTEYMKTLQTKVNEVVHVTNFQSELLKTVAYKSIDLEARSKRNNLLFFGFEEDRTENCFHRVRTVIYDKLELDSDNMYLCRAHRVGQPRRGSARPIIVNFRDFGDVESIMSRVFKLKGSPISIDRDIPKEIREARRRLRPLFLESKSRFPTAKVQIVYPAKLLRDRQVIRDELPDWFSVLGKSRLYDAKTIDAMTIPTSQSVPKTHSLSTYTADPIAATDTSPSYTEAVQDNENTQISNGCPSIATSDKRLNNVPISKDGVHVPSVFNFGSVQENSTVVPTAALPRSSRAVVRGNGARQRAFSTVITSRERRSVSRVPKCAQSSGGEAMKSANKLHLSVATLCVKKSNPQPNKQPVKSVDNIPSQAASKVIQSGANVSLGGTKPKQPVSMAGNKSSQQDPDDTAPSPPSTPVNAETPPQH